MLHFDGCYGSHDIRLIELSKDLVELFKKEKEFGKLKWGPVKFFAFLGKLSCWDREGDESFKKFIIFFVKFWRQMIIDNSEVLGQN